MHSEPRDGHLSAGDAAAYVDRQLTGPGRARIEEHLAACAECRREAVAVGRLARSLANRRRWTVALPLAAAAAALLLILPWGATDRPVLREPGVTTTVAPRLVAPVGAVSALPSLVWTSVPHADLYRVTVFDSSGGIVWETRTADTTAVPANLPLQPRTSYFWKVAARTAWGRWALSDLSSFTLSAARLP